MYVNATIVDNILYVLLLFLSIIGLFMVSAGEKIHIPIIDSVPTIIFVGVFSVVYIDISGIPINAIVDTNKHIHVLDAWIPNEGILIIPIIIIINERT